MKTDHLFYRLFQTLPRLFFDIAGRSELAEETYRFQSVEVKQTAFRLDGIFLPANRHPDLPLFFIEVQFQADPAFYARLFAEIFLYLKQYPPANPWQAVIIYPNRTVYIGNTLPYQALLQSPQVHRIYLDEWASRRC